MTKSNISPNKIILIISLVFLALAFFVLKDKTTNNVLIDTSANELRDSLLRDSINVRIRNYDSVIIKRNVKVITDIKVNTIYYENFKDSMHSSSFDSLYKFIWTEYK